MESAPKHENANISKTMSLLDKSYTAQTETNWVLNIELPIYV